LLLATPIDRAACVFVALQIALLATCAEAVSVGGSDNLVVPLGIYYLLLKTTPRPAGAIAVQFVVQVAILVAVLLVARRTRLVTAGGAIAAHLVLYGAFSLGGPMWTAAPVGALVAFIVLDRWHGGTHGVPRGGYEVLTIYYVAVVAVLALFADNSFATLLPLHPRLRSGHPFYPLYVGALAATLAILAHEMRERVTAVRRAPPAMRWARALAIGVGAVLLPGLAVLGPHATVETIVTTVLVVVVAVAAYAAVNGRVVIGDAARSHLRVQAACVLIAVLLVLPIHFAWTGIAPWNAAP
jgi:hypothetical protein